MDQPKWEYTAATDYVVDERHLNAYGEEGWELISTVWKPGPVDGGTFVYVFKRRLS